MFLQHLFSIKPRTPHSLLALLLKPCTSQACTMYRRRAAGIQTRGTARLMHLASPTSIVFTAPRQLPHSRPSTRGAEARPPPGLGTRRLRGSGTRSAAAAPGGSAGARGWVSRAVPSRAAAPRGRGGPAGVPRPFPGRCHVRGGARAAPRPPAPSMRKKGGGRDAQAERGGVFLLKEKINK